MIEQTLIGIALAYIVFLILRYVSFPLADLFFWIGLHTSTLEQLERRVERTKEKREKFNG